MAPPMEGLEAGAEGRCCSCCRAWGVTRCALVLLSCALLASLAALAALLLLPAPPPTTAQSGVRLVLRGPGRTMKSGTLEWYADDRIDGVYLQPGFEYNPASHMLKMKKHGLYHVYAQLSAVHVVKSSCKKEGNATLTIHRKVSHGSVPILTLPLHLSSSSNKPLAAFAAVSPCPLAEGDILYVTLTVSKPVETDRCKSTQWYFGEGTVFGLSPISGNCNSEATGASGCNLAVPWKWSGY